MPPAKPQDIANQIMALSNIAASKGEFPDLGQVHKMLKSAGKKRAFEVASILGLDVGNDASLTTIMHDVGNHALGRAAEALNASDVKGVSPGKELARMAGPGVMRGSSYNPNAGVLLESPPAEKSLARLGSRGVVSTAAETSLGLPAPGSAQGVYVGNAGETVTARPVRAVKDLATRAGAVAEEAAGAAGGVGEAAAASGVVGKILSKAPWLAKVGGAAAKLAGPVGGVLLAADIGSRLMDWGPGKADRERAARAMAALGMGDEFVQAAGETATDAQAHSLVRSQSAAREVGVAAELGQPGYDAAQVAGVVGQKRNEIMQTAYRNRPTAEEYELAMRLIAGMGS